MNYKSLCEFDGRGFNGWQSQPEENTIQDNIESSMKKILSQTIRINGVGRTDSNVSAENYVFNFRSRSIRDIDQFRNSLNAVTDRRIHIKSIEEAEPEFDARRMCVCKSYRYQILNTVSPLRRHFHWEIERPVDFDKFSFELSVLEGAHDFTSFCRRKSLKESNTVKLSEINVIRIEDEIIVRFTGDRFLHNMIRFIIGTAVDISLGAVTESMKDILKSRNVENAGRKAPGNGLIFEYAKY